MAINWTTTRKESALISAIVNRAVESGLIPATKDDRKTLNMDLTAVHLNDTPLELSDMLLVRAADFSHDIAGIQAHIDRTTGRLKNFFVPRLAAHEPAHA